MIATIPIEEATKGDYEVRRPFVYKGVQYLKGEKILASDDDLKFLLRNNLIV